MEEIKQLNRKRGAIKHKQTSFSQFVQPIQNDFENNKTIPDVTIIELQDRLDKFSMLLHEFEEVQIKIEYLCEENELDKQYEMRDEFINSFSSLSAIAKLILTKTLNVINVIDRADSVKSSPPTSVQSGSIDHIQGVKLPTINLMKFDGKYNNWLEFKDTFNSLIHTNSAINNIQKYHYLRASLEGEPLKVIQSLEFSSENYVTAWDLLCARYNNSRLLVHNHIKSLFEMETLSKESATGLRNLTDNVYKHLRALETLKQPVQHWDTLLIFVITSKLDKQTIREWEKRKISEEFPKLDDLSDFIRTRADWLETIEINHSSAKVTKEKEIRGGSKNVSLLVASRTCNFCKQNHVIYYCDEFLKLNVPDRIKKVNDLKLCSNCLCKGHNSKICKAGSCRHCKFKHNTLLHKGEQKTEQQVEPENTPVQVSLTSQMCNQQVLLSTVSLGVLDSSGQVHVIKALLDCGSQSNFVSAKLCKQLNLQKQSTNISVVGINKITSNLNYKCDVSIKALTSSFCSTITCFVLPTITDNIPISTINVNSLNIPNGIQLADPKFYEPSEINMLLGAGIFWQILTQQKIHLGKSMPILYSTQFGWIISGSINQYNEKTYCNFSKFIDLQCQLQKFWELEETQHSITMSSDDLQCENHFQNNVSRNNEGRFIVKIPLKYSPSNLGESKSLAIKRLAYLEKRFESNLELKNQYSQFIKEYIDMGHMSLKQQCSSTQFDYFLPHHGVIKQDSLTTKLRVVFDGTAPSDSGWSLNDLQYTGPVIQNDIFSILLRFRQHTIVVCSDIAKMYRQILVSPEDRHLQKILWRDNSNEPISMYTLNTVTYGTKSAPYLALRCLKQLSIDFQEQYPEACKIISRDFYVDDLITGFESEQAAVDTCKEISSILNSACFPLRKWISNNPNILQEFQDPNEPISVLNLQDNEQSKTLGICWCSKSDTLTYHISHLPNHCTITKRNILSDVSKIYDPLGLVSPCIIISKILLQNLWTLKLQWDDSVPNDVQKKWSSFRESLHYLNQVQINRHVIGKNSTTQIQLHGYCDASKDAYAACIYVRSIDGESNIHVNLLCAKTKVAPLKSQTIPRLELCSALLLSRLLKSVQESITIDFSYFLWSDSQIVLCWIQTQPNKLQTFVQNRIAEIQELTEVSRWNYVNTKENPADLASRGVLPTVLLKSDLWWKGPSWLSLHESSWPKSSFNIPDVQLPEFKQQTLASVTMHDISFPFERFSNLNKLQRTMAYCLRFISNCRKLKEDRKVGQLTVSELNLSMKCLVRLSQSEFFSDEIIALKSNQSPKSKHRLISLSPFLDDESLLRVGGRLKHSELNFENKHPLLLAGKHYLTKLIFENMHKALLHAGPQLLLATIRQTYWPTSGMNAAKRTTRNCVKCFRYKPKSINPIMAHLPKDRVTCMNPFYISGIDYAGPFLLKDRKGHGSKTIKAYVCLFICFASKAVHIELVTDLTTESFISCLRRFSSRRGKPAHIYSDNATNFVGAAKKVQDLHDFFSKSNDEIVKLCANDNITWHFIPPNSPHFGGLWESGIKSVKYHLHRAIGEARLTYEEFYSVLVQIEGILNSRPIHPLSSDPNDFQPLTPSHFLIGKPLVTLPDPHVMDIPVNRLDRYQFLQQINQSFWRRWSTQYLSSLQERSRWKHNTSSLKKDILVLIKQDTLPPCKWLLGRIVELHPGDDQVVRVATVKTQNGIFKRAVAKLCPLPLPATDPSPISESDNHV